jgi:hypothetical protein
VDPHTAGNFTRGLGSLAVAPRTSPGVGAARIQWCFEMT